MLRNPKNVHTSSQCTHKDEPLTIFKLLLVFYGGNNIGLARGTVCVYEYLLKKLSGELILCKLFTVTLKSNTHHSLILDIQQDIIETYQINTYVLWQMLKRNIGFKIVVLVTISNCFSHGFGNSLFVSIMRRDVTPGTQGSETARFLLR